MSNKKKNIEQLADVTETGLTYSTDIIEIKEPTIFDKYADLIKAAKDGNIEGKWTIEGIFEILRYIEKIIGRNMPLDWNCDACIIQLILTFEKYK